MNELTLEENIRQILPTLPLPIQKFFEQRKLGVAAHLLMERYALHVDQGAILERELMLLLLGLENPDTFASELYENLPISQQTVSSIMTDINQEIFVPLQKQMREGGNGQQTAKPIPPPPPQPTRFVRPITSPQRPSAPAPSYQPPRPPPPPVPVQPVSKPIPPPQVVRQVSPTPPPPPRPNPVQQQIPTKPDHLLPIGEQWKHVSAPLPPKTAMPWPEGKARPAIKLAPRVPATVSQPDNRPPPPAPEEMPGATGNAGWPPVHTPLTAPTSREVPVPASPPPPSGGTPQKYIRTYGGDMATVQQGGAPDLVPIETAHKAVKPLVPESTEHPSTHSYIGDPYREPIE